MEVRSASGLEPARPRAEGWRRLRREGAPAPDARLEPLDVGRPSRRSVAEAGWTLDAGRRTLWPVENNGTAQTEQIFGIRFFNGTPAQAVAQMLENGGLLVAPSGTCFERLLEDEDYRRAVVTADLALADSGLMVVLWRLLRGRSINRISGLAYLKHLLAERSVRQNERTLWILPNASARERLLTWSVKTGIPIAAADCYVAPIYGKAVHDEALVSLIATSRPQQIIIGIGAGPQEKLGWYLRENAGYAPAIHCIGGALGFVTGDQVVIPPWADRLYLGWFLRLLSQPRVMLPRLWKARVLPGLIVRYGERLPPLTPIIPAGS